MTYGVPPPCTATKSKSKASKAAAATSPLPPAGADAISQALGLFPCVRSVTVKAVRTRILG